ncbi:permease-like cell division protein FtsX [Streptomyces anulatus]
MLVVTVGFGATRLLSPPVPGGQDIVTMSMSGAESSKTPTVRVFLCKGDDLWPNCAGDVVTGTEREDILRMLRARPEVESVSYRDRRTAWKQFRRAHKDNATLLRAVTIEDMPEAFDARIRRGGDPRAVAMAAVEWPGASNAIDGACAVEQASMWSMIVNSLPWAGARTRARRRPGGRR